MRNTDEFDFNWYKWYTPKVRVLCHLLFWLFISILYYLNYTRIAGNNAWFFVLKELFVVTTIFYSVSTGRISRLFANRKILWLIPWVIFAYIWWAGITYFTCLAYQDYFIPSTPRLDRYLNLILSSGLDGMLWQELPVYILDFIFLISLPLGPKLMKSLMQQGFEKTKLERDNLELELNFLKSQINPHFLFNTLNNIYQLLDIDRDMGREMVLRLSALMRYTLYDSKSDYILLSKEIDFIKDFLELMRLRYDQRVSIKADFAPINEPYKIIPLIMIPFVENAFKHGPDRSRLSTFISIIMKLEGDTLFLTVENSTTRISKQKSNLFNEVGGVGMENVKRRLDLHYKENYKLEIEEPEGKYIVHLSLYLK